MKLLPIQIQGHLADLTYGLFLKTSTSDFHLMAAAQPKKLSGF